MLDACDPMYALNESRGVSETRRLCWSCYLGWSYSEQVASLLDMSQLGSRYHNTYRSVYFTNLVMAQRRVSETLIDPRVSSHESED
jgi:hypothetical protein